MVALVVVVNLILLRRVVGPLQELTALARRVDLARPGERMPGAARTSEAAPREWCEAASRCPARRLKNRLWRSPIPACRPLRASFPCEAAWATAARAWTGRAHRAA